MADPTIQEIIAAHPKAFQPELAQGVRAEIQYHLSGEEGGDWIIHIHDGVCEVASGVAKNPTITLAADSRDYKIVLLGKANGMQYFMLGKLKLTGDLTLAMKLTGLFKLG